MTLRRGATLPCLVARVLHLAVYVDRFANLEILKWQAAHCHLFISLCADMPNFERQPLRRLLYYSEALLCGRKDALVAVNSTTS